jgi:hypothetical protein
VRIARQGKSGRSRGSPRRSRTAKAARISRDPGKSRGACETGGWGRSKPGWTETTELGPEPRTPGVSGASRGDDPSGLPFGATNRSTGDHVVGGCARDHANPHVLEGMPGAGFTSRRSGKARSDRLILKPYWGKPAVRNFKGGGGNVGIIRSPVRATVLPDH